MNFLPNAATRYFGEVTYNEQSVVFFPQGLHGFEERKRYLLIQQRASNPLSFLQSLDEPALCFPAMPATQVDPDFILHMDDDSWRLLGLHPETPAHPDSLLVLAIVSIDEVEPPAANLLGPVVIHVPSRRGAQVIQLESGHLLRHPVPALDEVLYCW